MRNFILVLVAAMALLARADDAATIYVNANIHTLDGASSRAEAMAVDADGMILAVGSRAQAEALRTAATETIDLQGRTVIPGLIDAHGHMLGLGAYGLGLLDLSQATSYNELVATVAGVAHDAEPGAWVLGGRWDHESWPSHQLPHHAMLSEATADHPVWLRRVDGHAGLANARAMRLAGVTASTPDPPGGKILRDAQGQPTGVFVDNAMGLITRAIDAPTPSIEDQILRAQEICLSVGLTGAHDPGISPAEALVYERLAASGRLKMRIVGMLSASYALDYMEHHEPLTDRAGPRRFTLRTVKLYADGAMGSRGAWLLGPYSDRPVDDAGRPYTGLAVTNMDLIERVTRAALAHGWQVRTHAIGDRANREVLDAYERALTATGTLGTDHRLAIEHLQMIHPDDMPRLARLGVVASMQPRHWHSDSRWIIDRVGFDRARGAYAWASVLRSGARLAFGSDFPVEPPNPMLGLYAAVVRPNEQPHPSGTIPLGVERLTRTEALRAFTTGAAFVGFDHQGLGVLAPGHPADFIVLDRDVMTVPADEIPEITVLRTVIAGETVFAR